MVMVVFVVLFFSLLILTQAHAHGRHPDDELDEVHVWLGEFHQNLPKGKARDTAEELAS